MPEKPNDILREAILDKLLFGIDLSEQEQQYYEEIKRDSDFQQEQRLLSELKKPLALENRKLLKSQLAKKEEALQSTARVFKLRPVLAIAASFLVLIAAGFLFLQDSPKRDLFVDNYDVYPSIIKPIVKGEINSSSLLDEAMINYQESNFKLANEQLSKIDRVSDTVLFYKAITEIELGEDQKSLETFELIDDRTSRFYKESQWYSALLVLKDGQNEKAKTLFQSIVTDSKHPYTDEAARIILNIK